MVGMTHVLLFHHALGRTNGVLAFADQLRARGLTVTVADLFEGQVFDDVVSLVEAVS
jgi:dienelactone hydrolase